jgi:hypothetical protein
MAEPAAPGVRRYLHAGALWLAIAVIGGIIILQVLSGKAFANGQTLLLVLLPGLAVMLAGIGLLWLALAKARIRKMVALIAIGALAGFALTTGIAFAVSYALHEPRLWLFVLVPANLAGGAIAGAYLGKAAPGEQEFWPSPRSW